jgi:serine/threonine-protein kinase
VTAAETTEIAAGTTIGEYEVGKLLGTGGFGSVYAAVHPLIGKQVAIKVLTLRYSVDPAIVSRFVAEARAVNQIRHQHIIDIFSFGKLPDGRQYYVMELLDGEPLDRYLRGTGRLAATEAVEILHPIALALDAAHAAGVIHRDLKPENVFVARDAKGAPFPKLLDFGLAKLLGSDLDVDHSTNSGTMMGTPHYMSPQQCRGRGVDHRTDFYALGVMTYLMVTGELPFVGDDAVSIVFQQISDQPARPSDRVAGLSAEIDEAVLAMLAKDPEDRPDTAVEAIDALAVAVGIPELAPGGVLRNSAKRFRSGRPSGTPIASKPGSASTLPAGSDPPVAPAPKTMSLPVGEVTPPPRAKRTWIGAAIAAAAVAGIVAWRLMATDAQPEPVATNRAVPADAPARPDAPPPIDAAPPAVDVVTIRITDTPPNTSVTRADGVILGVAPGVVHVPRSDAVLELHLVHDGYQERVEKVQPLTDLGPLALPMQNKAVARPVVEPPHPPQPPQPPQPDDIGPYHQYKKP